MRKSLLTILMALSLGSVAQAADTAALEQSAAKVTADYIQQLTGVMKQQMQAGGPEAAVKVCTDVAPQISARVSLENGWQVRRVGTRVRNSVSGMPDVWEQKALANFETRRAAGEDMANMTLSELVTEPAGRYFRYAKAIGVLPQCALCHGAPDQIAEPVKVLLKQQYPHDKATGYKAGDLRGAVTIKIPM